MQLAHRFGKRLSHRGKGGIVFVASMMGEQGAPYFATCAASKAYTLVLGESLHHELKQQGVDVLVLAPGLTHTAMPAALSADGVDFSKTSMPMMKARPVVRGALADLGHRSSVVPGIANGITSWINRRILTRHQASGLFGRMIRKAMPAHQL
jgi:short-subunit dehydrogenase